MTIGRWIKEITHAPPIIQRDFVSPTLSHLLSITIGSKLSKSDQLPLGHHLLLFPTACNEAELSEDGYTNEHAPPSPYRRRLWGGGAFYWRKPLIIGDSLLQITKVKHAEIKGSNVYVYLEKIIYKECLDDWSMKENRTMIYLKDDTERKIRDGPVLKGEYDTLKEIIPTQTLLFRYSALTFNAHKIHLDTEYTRNVEGFPELLVHGPLTCTLLLNLAQEETVKWGYPASFSYRAISPLFANCKMGLSIKFSQDENVCKLNAFNLDQKTIGMTGTFNFSPP